MNDYRKQLLPKFQVVVDQFDQLTELMKLPGILAGFTNSPHGEQEMLDNLASLKQQADEIISVISRFNNIFQPLGWILSESTNLETARAAIQQAESQNIAEAEKLLCADYDGDGLDALNTRLSGSHYFYKRNAILEEAVQLTKEKRYLAAIPLILLVADGVGQDIFGKSIFREGLDLSEMNAIAGHSEGLQALTATFAKRRQPFNDEEITIPYRNGILHGRDNNYGTRLVASKAWSYLACVRDIIGAREERQNEVPKPELSLEEVIAGYQETLVEKSMYEKWSPRPEGSLSNWTLSTGSLEAMDSLVPEAKLKAFLKAWHNKNYGEMGRLTLYYTDLSPGKRAGQIRECMEGVQLLDAEISAIEDGLAIETTVTCQLKLTVLGQEITDIFGFRILYLDEENLPVVRGHKRGQWKIVARYQGYAYDLRNKFSKDENNSD